MRNSTVFIFLLVASLLSSCSKYSFKTSFVNEQTPINGKKGIVYPLPINKVAAVIWVKQTTHQKGIYADYASKYLGLDVLLEDKTTYAIDKIELQNTISTRGDRYCFVNINEDCQNILPQIFNNDNQGLYLSSLKIQSCNSKATMPNDINPLFTATVITSGNQTERIDTVYKTVLKDSVYVRLPIITSRKTEKTSEEKAKEMADFILEIKKAKLMMLTGSSEHPISVDYLTKSIEELNALEKERVDFFTGISQTQVKPYFLNIDLSKSNSEPTSLTYFSETDGINALQGKQIEVKITDLQKTAQIKISLPKQKNCLFYPIAGEASFEIFIDKSPVLLEQLPIYQFGETTCVAPEFLLQSFQK